MLAAGAALGLGGSLLKKGPKIPTYKPVDQTKEQEAAIAANLASFDQARQLADQTTAADQDRLDSMLARTMPNYRELLSGAGSAVQNMIAGQLPMADQQMIMRRAAERGTSMGLGGSAAGRNLTARDLGLSSLQMTQAGLGAFNQLSSNLRQNYMVNPMSTSSMYVSPSQRIANSIQENQFAYNALVGKRQSDAANSFGNKLAGFASTAGGMMMGAGLQGMMAPAAAAANPGTVGAANAGNAGFFSRMRSSIGGMFGMSGTPQSDTLNSSGMPNWATS
jgi:hypothetical protein